MLTQYRSETRVDVGNVAGRPKKPMAKQSELPTTNIEDMSRRTFDAVVDVLECSPIAVREVNVIFVSFKESAAKNKTLIGVEKVGPRKPAFRGSGGSFLGRRGISLHDGILQGFAFVNR